MINSDIALVSKMSGMSRIEVDKRSDIFPSAVFINGVSIMGGIQQELLDMEFWKICFHREEGMEKRKHIMTGSPLQKRKNRKVAVGIGSHIHVEVVTEEIGFPVGIPSPVTVGLGIMTLAVTGRTAFFLTITESLFPLLCGSTDRSAVSSKSQMFWIDQAFMNRRIQELMAIELENKGKRIFRF